jgi:hypothetical protein
VWVVTVKRALLDSADPRFRHPEKALPGYAHAAEIRMWKYQARAHRLVMNDDQRRCCRYMMGISRSRRQAQDEAYTVD